MAALLTLAGAGVALLVNDKDAAVTMRPAAAVAAREEPEPAVVGGGQARGMRSGNGGMPRMGRRRGGPGKRSK